MLQWLEQELKVSSNAFRKLKADTAKLRRCDHVQRWRWRRPTWPPSRRCSTCPRRRCSPRPIAWSDTLRMLRFDCA